MIPFPVAGGGEADELERGSPLREQNHARNTRLERENRETQRETLRQRGRRIGEGQHRVRHRGKIEFFPVRSFFFPLPPLARLLPWVSRCHPSSDEPELSPMRSGHSSAVVMKTLRREMRPGWDCTDGKQNKDGQRKE